MIKKKHKEYTIEDLREGNTRMVDPYVNPNKAEYDDDLELGIDDEMHAGKRRWTIDTYKQRDGEHKTDKIKEMKKQDLKDIIKECIREVLTENSVKTVNVRIPNNMSETKHKAIRLIHPEGEIEEKAHPGGAEFYIDGKHVASYDYDNKFRVTVTQFE
jgi:hypothetical protein